MVTASHNPECDNGVKMVDADGSMMNQLWEPYAEDIVNTGDVTNVLTKLKNIAELECAVKGVQSVIIIGRDTRPHSKELVKCIIMGAESFGAIVFDIGEVTTPQLHFIVQKANENASHFPVLVMDREIALKNYYNTLGNGFLRLGSTATSSKQSSYLESLVVDGSYGIGSISVIDLASTVNKIKNGSLDIDLRNGAFEGPVNDGCGAEYVQKEQLPPKNFNPQEDVGKILCSFDGDADRIVFHSFLKEQNNEWILIDGDKIAALFSLFMSQELEAAGLNEEYRLGVVQTAYANGASTIFLKNHNIPVTIAKTGVKYLHHKAQEFDLGIYFEANGHGTVQFSDRFLKHIQFSEGMQSSSCGRKILAIERLQVSPDY